MESPYFVEGLVAFCIKNCAN